MIQKNKIYFRISIIVIAAILLFIPVLISKYVTSDTFTGVLVHHVRNNLYRKESFLEKEMFLASRYLEDDRDLHGEDGDLLREKLAKKEMILFIFHKDSLFFWSDNTVPLNHTGVDLQVSSLVFLGNGWYIPRVTKTGEFTILGLILIQHRYPIENHFLKQDFFRGSWLGNNYELVSVPSEGIIPVYHKDGTYCFGLKIKDPDKQPLFWKWLSFILFVSGFLLTVISVLQFIRKNQGIIHPGILSTGVLILSILFGVVISGRILPENFYALSLFSPFYFALASWCPSMGDLFFQTILFFLFVYSLRISFENQLSGAGKWIVFVILIFSVIVFSAATELLYRLISNSSVVFEPNRVLDLSEFSILGIMSFAFLFISFLLLIDLGLTSSGRMRASIFWTGILVSSLAILPMQFFVHAHVPWYAMIIYWLFAGILFWIKSRSTSLTLFFTAFVVGLFTTVLMVRYSEVRREQDARLLVTNLAAEHDPVAELLMEETGKQLRQDQELPELMKKKYFSQTDVDQITQYLKRTYFNGYWEKYDLLVILCTPESDILVNEEPNPCHVFFTNLLSSYGSPIGNTGFYYLDMQNGLVSYLSTLYYPVSEGADSNGLYIQLDSKILYEQLGYPELLLDEKSKRESIPSDYNYAKYYHGNLVAQKGDFPYPIADDVFPDEGDAFDIFIRDKYKHIVYRPNEDSTIVMSYKALEFTDYLISFAYYFVFFFLILMVILFKTVFPIDLDYKNLLLKQKIQLWIFLLLLIVFILVGFGTIYLNRQQFYRNHLSNLKEKLQSVYVELEHKLSFEEKLDRDWSSAQYASLYALLVKFSNVFYTDINLYTNDGMLLATSRPEIFEQKLLSNRMNEEALYQLSQRKVSEFVHRESIGKLTFLSAYTPFFNQDNKMLAYLNLPYFTKQNLLAREISNMIVGIVNSWMVLILISFALAVFISDKITSPLRRIQEKIGKFKFGKEYEHIVYSGNDEIGGLVREYNHMIDELAKNIELLAKTERESAWREMARQIAHEIKNPLTPMKLSIQQLKRSWDDNRDDFKERLEQVASTLVEQIDRLSRIATAFSNFARMPKTHYQPIELDRLIEEIVTLFGSDQNLDVTFRSEAPDGIRVYADKEELTSVFVNLLKNAAQSVPRERKGQIAVELSLDEQNKNAIVSVCDNGLGISPDLGDRLFEPNFTTKSSGMGLGLAIVKKIVDDTGGRIWYQPNDPAGTVFMVSLPVYAEKEQESKGKGS